MTECVRLLPSHTHYWILSISWSTKIAIEQWVIVCIFKVTCPYHRIWIYADNTIGIDISRLTQWTLDCLIVNFIILHPEGIYTNDRTLWISATSYIKLIRAHHSLVDIHPCIVVAQCRGLQPATTFIIEHRRQDLCHWLVWDKAILPWNTFFPVDSHILIIGFILAWHRIFAIATFLFNQQ